MVVRISLLIFHYACFTTARKETIQNHENKYDFPEVFFSYENRRAEDDREIPPEKNLPYLDFVKSPNNYLQSNLVTQYPIRHYPTVPNGQVIIPPENTVVQNGGGGLINTALSVLSKVGMTTAVILSLIVIFVSFSRMDLTLPAMIMSTAGINRPMYINYVNNIHVEKLHGHDPNLPESQFHKFTPIPQSPYRPIFPIRSTKTTEPSDQIRRKLRRAKKNGKTSFKQNSPS